jgi:hypothetical protein
MGNHPIRAAALWPHPRDEAPVRSPEAAMHHIRRIIFTLTGLATAVLALAAMAPAAFANRVPPVGGAGGPVPLPREIHTIVIGGMPGWQIILIAATAALLAAALAVFLDRAWAARRDTAAPG